MSLAHISDEIFKEVFEAFSPSATGRDEFTCNTAQHRFLKDIADGKLSLEDAAVLLKNKDKRDEYLERAHILTEVDTENLRIEVNRQLQIKIDEIAASTGKIEKTTDNVSGEVAKIKTAAAELTKAVAAAAAAITSIQSVTEAAAARIKSVQRSTSTPVTLAIGMASGLAVSALIWAGTALRPPGQSSQANPISHAVAAPYHANLVSYLVSSGAARSGAQVSLSWPGLSADRMLLDGKSFAPVRGRLPRIQYRRTGASSHRGATKVHNHRTAYRLG